MALHISKIRVMATAAVVSIAAYFVLFRGSNDTKTNPGGTVSDTTYANQFYALGEKFTKDARFDSANAWFEKASAIYEKEDLWESVVNCRNYIGDNIRRMGDYVKSLSYLDSTLRLANHKLPELNAARAMTLNKLGLFYRDKKESEKALDYFNRALSVRRQVLDPGHVEIGWSYNNIGLVNYDLGNFNEALRMYDTASQIITKVSAEDNLDLALIYNNIGTVYNDKGAYEKALEFYMKSLRIRQEKLGSDHIIVAQNYNNIGIIHRKRGDLDEALRYYNLAISIRVNKLGPAHPDVALSYYNAAFVYKDQAKLPTALDYFDKALAIWLNKFGNDHLQVARTYDEIGRSFYLNNQLDSALSHFQISLNILSRISQSKSFRLSYIYNDIGNVYLKRLDFLSAQKSYQRSLEISLDYFGQKHPDVSECYSNLAVAYSENGDYERSLEFNQKALDALRIEIPNVSNHEPDILDIPKWINGHERNGDFHMKQFRKKPRNIYLNEAVEAYETASGYIIKQRRGFRSEESKLYLGQKAVSLFEKAIHASFERFNLTHDTLYLEKAFAFSERSKASVLLESLFDAEARKFAGIPDSILEYENRLRARISFYNKKISAEQQKPTGQAGSSMLSFQSKLFDAVQQYNAYINSLERRYPEYYHLKFKFEPITIKKLQASLGNNVTLIEYFVGDSSIFLFLIDPVRSNVVSVPKDFSFDAGILSMKKGLTERNFALYAQSAFKIYRQIFEPVYSFIKTDHLVIVPDGSLEYIPFETLISKPAGDSTQDYSKLSYLVKQFTISYAYSSTFMIEGTKSKPAGVYDNVIGFSPMTFRK